jgi:hypothetical protein
MNGNSLPSELLFSHACRLRLGMIEAGTVRKGKAEEQEGRLRVRVRLREGGKKRKSHARRVARQTELFYWCVLRSRCYLLVIGPISQMDVLFNFSAFVTMFVRFVRPISGLAEWIFSCP